MPPPKAKSAPGEAFFQLSLLLLVSTGYAAVLTTGRLDRATAAAAGLALVARALIICGWLRIPLSEPWVRVLTIAYIGFYPFDFLYLSGTFVGATVRLVFFLAVVRLLTARTGRDYLSLGVIAFLELLSAAVLTSSPTFLGFLVLFLLFAVAARTSYEIRSSSEKAIRRAPAGRMTTKLAALCAGLAAGIVVLSLGLFFVVPRAAGAYLSRLPPSGEAVVGFSDEVTLGTFGRISTSDAPVLRVRILEGRPGTNLKWRGGALRHFDGVKWSNPASYPQLLQSSRGQYIVARLRQRQRVGSRIRYRVLRAPLETETLFLAGIPESVGGQFSRLEVSETDSISLPGGRWRSLVYEGSSFIDPQRPQELRAFNLDGPYPERISSLFLQLPELDARIPRLARYLSDAQVSTYWRAAAIEHHLRTEFGYTLELPAEPPADPLADFLFRRRKGHCEYFASAMTVMLRSIGVPARLVSGFQNGVYNPVTDSFTIRAADAHAWVEAYIAGFGWVTFDPTPPAPQAADAGTFHQLWLLLDALDTYWNEWVVQYDLARQVRLARAVRGSWYKASYETSLWLARSRQWIEQAWNRMEQSPIQTFWPILAVVSAAGAAAWAWPRVRARAAARRVARGVGNAEDCALLYLLALERMKRRGFVRPQSQTPEEFAAALAPSERQRRLARLTSVYNRARFGRDVEAARQLPALVRSLEDLPW